MFVPSLKSLLGVIGIAITTIIEMVTWWNSAVFFHPLAVVGVSGIFLSQPTTRMSGRNGGKTPSKWVKKQATLSST